MVKINMDGQTIIGSSDGQIDSFIGIPYTKPLNHITRFKHSQLDENTHTFIEANQVQAIPPQPYNTLEDFFSIQPHSFSDFKQSEDCLYLNIWRKTTTNNHLKPVVIYFYGGGFIQGHGTAHLYQPYHVVEQEDIIVVTFNYRIGALGYLNWSYFNDQYDYNNGISDQINLLKWIHKNIAFFGGDPQNVTLMGQSAGSMSIMALMQIPKLDQYYNKVMLLSGTLHSDSIKTSRSKAQQFRNLITKHYPESSIESLTNENLLDIMSLHKIERGHSRSLDLIYQPIQSKDMTRPVSDFTKPIFVCVTNAEGDIYIENESRKLLPHRFKEVMSLFDIHIFEEDIQTAQQQREKITTAYFKDMALKFLNHNVSKHKWLARFDWCQPESDSFKSAYHILDMVFWFGNLDILKSNNYRYTQSDKRLSQQMIVDLAHFARNGRMPWTQYTNDHHYFHIYK